MFNGRFIVNLADFASQQVGSRAHDLISSTGMSADELCQEDCTVENDIYNRLVEEAVKMTDDPFFGLHAGENLNLASAGLIAQITHSSSTVKQALEYCCEYANLGCSVLPMSLVEMDNAYKVCMTPDPLWRNQSEISVRHTAEGVVAFSIREFHSLTRFDKSPLKVYLPWKSKEYSEYNRVFGCTTLDGKDEIAIFFDKKDIETPVFTSDYNLLRVLLAHAEEKMAKFRSSNGFQNVVRKSIINLVKPEFPSLEEVSSHLNMSVRTLQRKLKQENLSFKEIIDDLKKEFAISYLKKEELTISEIAYLLNYSDSSAFNRAFKKWTNQTPMEYRQLNAFQ